MKHIKQAEHRLAETTAYLYIICALMKLFELTKSGCKAILRHIMEVVAVTSFVGTIIAAQEFDKGAIDCITALLIITALGAITIVAIKLKIIESERK